MTLAKIISEGQTGVDRGALDTALEIGFPCGGWCPPGREAEDGAIPDCYPVQELASGSYRRRTLQNVLDSDGTLVVHFGELEGVTGQTLRHCGRLGKPCIRTDATAVPIENAATLVAAFIAEHRTKILNVARPRASKEPHGHGYTQALMLEVLRSAVSSFPSTG